MHVARSSAYCTSLHGRFPLMSELGDRLRRARLRAGFAEGKEAARRVGVPYNTYAQHENGNRGFRADKAETYAKAFGVDLRWLLTGRGDMAPVPAANEVPIVGFVRAGAEAILYDDGQGPFGLATAPANSTENTVAVEIRGDSLGPFFNEWLVFYDDVRSPVTPDLHGSLCVVGLEDRRVLIKKLAPSRTPGLFHLLSQTEDPILDVPVLWAARVKEMRPR